MKREQYKIRNITKFVCKYNEISLREFKSINKRRDIVYLRKIIVFVSLRYTKYFASETALFRFLSQHLNISREAIINYVKYIEKTFSNKIFNNLYSELTSLLYKNEILK